MRQFPYLLLLLFCFSIREEPPIQQKTVVLNMIVKNESHVITRCLASALPLIDYWVIVDTGSTDGTQEMIKNFMEEKGVPGELHERPWVNFAHNRNEALDLAKSKGEYLLFIDADDYFVYDADFERPSLDRDRYDIFIKYGGIRYARPHLVNAHLDWEWIGVLHEYLSSSEIASQDTLKKVEMVITTEGDRSHDPQKYQKDAQILEAALKEEPNNSRNVFYLAQSYRDGKEYALALKNYEKRVSMGGWDQEVFYSLLQIGRIQEQLNMDSETCINSYLRAYNFRPTRAEPLYYLAKHYRQLGNHAAGYVIASIGRSIPLPSDILFVESAIYEYWLPLEHSIHAYWTGRYEECQQASYALLKKTDLPQNIRSCVERNLDFTNKKIREKEIVMAP